MYVGGKIIDYSKMLEKSTDERDQYASKILYDIGYMFICAETEEMNRKLLEECSMTEAMNAMADADNKYEANNELYFPS